jgi:predicted DNA-binding helix-hairpin-helix protein
MQLEQDGDAKCPDVSVRKEDDFAVSSAVLPNGKRIRLLKTLLTSACERDCYYCPFRAGRNFRRATFRPDEFAQLSANLYRAGMIEGIFLSSGIVSGGVRTQDNLIKTADILRLKLKYQGYLHLKIMPGAEFAQVEKAMYLADRVSVNLEAPNSWRLKHLAPNKEFSEELINPLQWVNEIRRTKSPHLAWNGRWPSSVTQYVVGGAGESDMELLQTTEYLYKQVGLSRAYYSPFNPIDDTPMENQPPTPPIREHRLYQASFLLRDYGFTLEDLPFEKDQNLPLKIDPKLAWAQINLKDKPVEVNRADLEDLLRVPGIGRKGAWRIIRARRDRSICDLSTLGSLGVRTGKAAPFVLLNGKRPLHQLGLAGFGLGFV